MSYNFKVSSILLKVSMYVDVQKTKDSTKYLCR